MKNHWVDLYEKKKKKIWTVEFSKNGLFSLKPRKIGIDDINSLNYQSGMVSILFYDSMFALNDYELMDFINEAHKSKLSGYVSRIRLYQGLSKELEGYELTGLKYDSVSSGDDINDIKFTLEFSHLRYYVNS